MKIKEFLYRVGKYIASVTVLSVFTLAFTACGLLNFPGDGERKPSEQEAAAAIMSDWMSYIKDDVPLADVIKIGAHDAGVMNSYVLSIKTDFLDCQTGTIGDLLTHGTRSFDFRLIRSSLAAKEPGVVYFGHG
ncbi:MAG: hypothetical protein LBC13_01605, partial [Clostridiales bacterium]|nr:hypothetical protein [Clostridiales bacterium]